MMSSRTDGVTEPTALGRTERGLSTLDMTRATRPMMPFESRADPREQTRPDEYDMTTRHAPASRPDPTNMMPTRRKTAAGKHRETNDGQCPDHKRQLIAKLLPPTPPYKSSPQASAATARHPARPRGSALWGAWRRRSETQLRRRGDGRRGSRFIIAERVILVKKAADRQRSKLGGLRP